MDYGKFKYDKSSQRPKLKQIRLRPKTGQHDFDFKVKKAIGFLEQDEAVQVSVLFRGREMAHIEEGRKIIENIIARLEEYGIVQSPPSQEVGKLVCTIAPLGK